MLLKSLDIIRIAIVTAAFFFGYQIKPFGKERI